CPSVRYDLELVHASAAIDTGGRCERWTVGALEREGVVVAAASGLDVAGAVEDHVLRAGRSAAIIRMQVGYVQRSAVKGEVLIAGSVDGSRVGGIRVEREEVRAGTDAIKGQRRVAVGAPVHVELGRRDQGASHMDRGRARSTESGCRHKRGKQETR